MSGKKSGIMTVTNGDANGHATNGAATNGSNGNGASRQPTGIKVVVVGAGMLPG